MHLQIFKVCDIRNAPPLHLPVLPDSAISPSMVAVKLRNGLQYDQDSGICVIVGGNFPAFSEVAVFSLGWKKEMSSAVCWRPNSLTFTVQFFSLPPYSCRTATLFGTLSSLPRTFCAAFLQNLPVLHPEPCWDFRTLQALHKTSCKNLTTGGAGTLVDLQLSPWPRFCFFAWALNASVASMGGQSLPDVEHMYTTH